MSLTKPCPRCQHALEIPQPAPEQIRCGRCGAVVNMKKRSTPALASTDVRVGLPAAVPPAGEAGQQQPRLDVEGPAPLPTPSPTRRMAAVILGAALVLGLSTGLILWLSSGGDKKSGTGDEKPVAEENLPKPKELPPPDPRIKIVQPAVDKGVAFLKASVPSLTGMRCGYVGLNGLTLLECGLSADDPAILRIAELIRAAAPTMNQNYDLAASLFFLNRWDEGRRLDEKDRNMARTLALRIIAGQMSNGIWGYGGVVMTPEQEAKLLTALQEGTYKPTGAGTVSMSNTQFAMLAVWGARRQGVPVREPLLALAAYFHANQLPDGRWIYPGHSLAATSTCAGLIALAIEMALLQEKEAVSRKGEPDGSKKKADADKAFEFVAKTIGRKKGDPNPGTSLGYGGALFDADAMGDLYFLWTLERVGVIYSKDLIGGKDWYDWGYPIVLAAQQPDGSWNERHGHAFGSLIDTSFALLFLKRANIARDLTEIIRKGRAH